MGMCLLRCRGRSRWPRWRAMPGRFHLERDRGGAAVRIGRRRPVPHRARVVVGTLQPRQDDGRLSDDATRGARWHVVAARGDLRPHGSIQWRPALPRIPSGGIHTEHRRRDGDADPCAQRTRRLAAGNAGDECHAALIGRAGALGAGCRGARADARPQRAHRGSRPAAGCSCVCTFAGEWRAAPARDQPVYCPGSEMPRTFL